MSTSPASPSFLFDAKLQTDGRLVARNRRDSESETSGTSSRADSRSWELRIKRALDLVGSGLGLLVAVPLFFVPICILIKLTSRGPILFRQRRMGQHGREFYCLKFRTMVPDAESKLADLENLNESGNGVLFKIKRDPRITSIGRFLRRSSLDELPQLFNILKGEMSLVGPRPLQLRDCDLLNSQDPDSYALRLSMPQGLTGLWQISGRSEAEGDSLIRLDSEYVNRWSLGLDLNILFNTFSAVIQGRGAC